MRRFSGTSALRRAIVTWMSVAHSTAAMTLGNYRQDAVARGVDDPPPELGDQR
jgi:hypothetical protein